MFDVRSSRFKKMAIFNWHAQRHSLERLVGVEETTIASRRLGAPGKSESEWRESMPTGLGTYAETMTFLVL
jgi:hypothetical protein